MASESVLFTKLVDVGAFMSHESQLHLGEVLGAYQYQTDIQAGEIRFTGDRPLTAKLQFLGTSAPRSGTWLWSWSPNATKLREYPGRSARNLLTYGRDHAVREFATEELPLEGALTWQRIAIAAKTAFSFRWGCHFAYPFGDTTVLALVYHDAFVLPPPTAVRTLRVFGEVLGSDIAILDHSRAINRYAIERHIHLDMQGPGWKLTFPDGVIQVDFTNVAGAWKVSKMSARNSSVGTDL